MCTQAVSIMIKALFVGMIVARKKTVTYSDGIRSALHEEQKLNNALMTMYFCAIE